MRSPSTTWLTPAALLGAGAVLVAGCSSPPPEAVADTPSASSTSSTSATVPALAGYRAGAFPPVPLLTVPDVTALTQSQQSVIDDLTARLGAIPGLEVTSARCDPTGVVVNSAGSLVLDGDGAGTFSDGRGTVVNDGAGAGVSSDGVTTIVNDGDGSGSYSDGSTTIVVNGDGSGTYSGRAGTVTLNGDGSGTATDGSTTLVNNGDGSGSWTDGSHTITNNGDGSGTWTGDDVTISNDGAGHASVGAVQVVADPLPPVAPAGRFPDVAALTPLGDVCGTLVRLPGDVLFDFDDDAVRSDAEPALQVLAEAVSTATGAVEVDGHTDGFGAGDYNQDLSQRRAASVVGWLTAHGVSAPLLPRGFGESRPIAPEVVDGHDDPAGRQLNRRVEFVLPGA